jgi:hypothetical protein
MTKRTSVGNKQYEQTGGTKSTSKAQGTSSRIKEQERADGTRKRRKDLEQAVEQEVRKIGRNKQLEFGVGTGSRTGNKKQGEKLQGKNKKGPTE